MGYTKVNPTDPFNALRQFPTYGVETSIPGYDGNNTAECVAAVILAANSQPDPTVGARMMDKLHEVLAAGGATL